MFHLGEKQTLTIIKQVEFGVYLAESMSAEEDKRVLLPGKQVPKEKEIGDTIEVFLYKDSKDRLIATTNEPKLQLGGIALLKVAEVGKIGAFLDWGLEKDLLLPFKQQTKKVHDGEECLVALYIDKSGRLCATMNVYEYLEPDVPYAVGEKVKGRVYQISEQFGAFVAIDDRYSALIPKKEMYGDIKINQIIEARVTAKKEDGRVDLSVREKAYLQMDEDAEAVLNVIQEDFDGELPFTDKAEPDIIKREFGLSKAAFKRAVGKLLKEGQIEITEKTIQIKK
jgi:uncharacterized protein